VGYRSKQQMRVAARAAVRNIRMVRIIADSYGNPYGGGEGPDLDQIESALERNDIDGIAQALPGLMQQVLGEQEQQ
jgi:hypothetical protein